MSFLESLQSERTRLLSKIRIIVKTHKDGQGDTIGCRDAESVLTFIRKELDKHEDWIIMNDPEVE